MDVLTGEHIDWKQLRWNPKPLEAKVEPYAEVEEARMESHAEPGRWETPVRKGGGRIEWSTVTGIEELLRGFIGELLKGYTRDVQKGGKH